MQVFKCFFKIVKKNAVGMGIYFGVFLLLSVFMSQFTADTQKVQYEDARLSIAVIDRDGSEASRALTEYMGNRHDLVELNDEKEEIQDALFARLVEYVLIIPEGFGEGLASEDPVQTENLKVPGSYTGYLVDNQIEAYLKYLRIYLQSGESVPNASARAEEVLSNTAKVAMQDMTVLSDMRSVFYYTQYLPFVFIAILAVGISAPLSVFVKKDIKMRNDCGALSLRGRNIQMLSAFMASAGIVWLVFAVVGFFLYNKELDSPGIPYTLLNSIAVLLVSASLAFLVGMNIKNENAKWAMVNVFSLGLSFLGGVFVPQQMMDEKILMVARFMPTYWYVKNNSLLGTAAVITDSIKTQFWVGILIQLGFAAAIFTAGLVFTKVKEGNN